MEEFRVIRMKIMEVVSKTIANVMECKEKDIPGDICLKNAVNMDSIDAVEVTMALEQKFDVSITDEEMDLMPTITLVGVCEIVERKLKEAGRWSMGKLGPLV